MTAHRTTQIDMRFDEVDVDLFAGGGGASLGVEEATGSPVYVAINHDAHAIEMHSANHPQTIHYREDVFAVDPIAATTGRPVRVLWASPDCKSPEPSSRRSSEPRSGEPHEPVQAEVEMKLCPTGKRCFASRAEARRCRRTVGNRFRVYRCPHCHSIHITRSR